MLNLIKQKSLKQRLPNSISPIETQIRNIELAKTQYLHVLIEITIFKDTTDNRDE